MSSLTTTFGTSDNQITWIGANQFIVSINMTADGTNVVEYRNTSSYILDKIQYQFGTVGGGTCNHWLLFNPPGIPSIFLYTVGMKMAVGIEESSDNKSMDFNLSIPEESVMKLTSSMANGNVNFLMFCHMNDNNVITQSDVPCDIWNFLVGKCKK
jgi:hypothetical protein